MRRQIGEARLAAAARAALGQRRIRSAEVARCRHKRPVAIMACAVSKLGGAHLATWRAGAARQRRRKRHRRLFMVEAHRLVHAHSRRAPRAAPTHDGASSQRGFSERVEWCDRRPRRGGDGTARRSTTERATAINHQRQERNRYLTNRHPSSHMKQITAQQEPGQPGSRSSAPGRGRADRRATSRLGAEITSDREAVNTGWYPGSARTLCRC